jgi:prohibitin 1
VCDYRLLGLLISVDGGERAVIFDRFSGVKPNVVGEGTHFIIPMIQKPIIFDIRSTPRPVTVTTGSKGTYLYPFVCTFRADLQNVNITLRILYRPLPEELPRIYNNIGEDYAERVLPSITSEVLKAVVVKIVLRSIGSFALT